MDNSFVKAIKTVFGEFTGSKPQLRSAQDDRQKLLDMVKQAKDELICADRGFDEAADKDVAEYYIYYRKAAEARYNYLIKAAKIKLGYEGGLCPQYKAPSAKY